VNKVRVLFASQPARICSLKARLPAGETPAFNDVRMTVCRGFASTMRSAVTLVSA
jgi:hypothetical protein